MGDLLDSNIKDLQFREKVWEWAWACPVTEAASPGTKADLAVQSLYAGEHSGKRPDAGRNEFLQSPDQGKEATVESFWEEKAF